MRIDESKSIYEHLQMAFNWVEDEVYKIISNKNEDINKWMKQSEEYFQLAHKIKEETKEKGKEIERLSMDGIVQRGEMDILVEDISQKNNQIEEMKEDVIGFSNWKVRNKYEAQFDFEPLWVNINDGNQERFTTEELYSKYKTNH